MGDEYGGHRSDAKHFSDSGLEHEEAISVIESWCAVETDILVNLFLDLLHHLRTRTRSRDQVVLV